jgi:NADPH:quinone reductase-like Zn-dependent oxidoreductase
MQGKALWYVAPGRAELRTEEVPAPKVGEVRVRALYGAISRGTERLVHAGRVPASEFERMRAPMMGGAFPFPVKYGYATVGRVELGPAELDGRIVFSLYPHQDVFTLPAAAVCPVPEDVPPARAVLAANMETALNAVWDGAPGPADRIAVVGGGLLGLLVAHLCARIPGTEVTVIDIAASRGELARALGADFVAPDQAPVDCDLVFHASASAAGLATALRLAGEEATIVELSWYGKAISPRRSAKLSTAAACGSSRARSARSRPRIARAGPMAGGSRRRWRCSAIPCSTCCSHLPSRLPICRQGCRRCSAPRATRSAS